VFSWNSRFQKWSHLDQLKCSIPRNTILEVEIVEELKGEVCSVELLCFVAMMYLPNCLYFLVLTVISPYNMLKTRRGSRRWCSEIEMGECFFSNFLFLRQGCVPYKLNHRCFAQYVRIPKLLLILVVVQISKWKNVVFQTRKTAFFLRAKVSDDVLPFTSSTPSFSPVRTSVNTTSP